MKIFYAAVAYLALSVGVHAQEGEPQDCSDPFADLTADYDGDGVPDCSESCPTTRFKTAPGICGNCFVNDKLDCDQDGNPNCLDQCPCDPDKTSPGVCGCGVVEEDLDGDGKIDCGDGGGGGIYGDPHFHTWSGENYDYHGVCDLVLLDNPSFQNGLGLRVHVRASKVFSFSYISSAVVEIGDEKLEVMGNEKGQPRYWINGVKGSTSVPAEALSGNPITLFVRSSRETQFTVTLANNQEIQITTHKDYVRVDFVRPTDADFAESFGLLGTFKEGRRVGRDKSTVIDDLNEFGQEWQVRDGNLFHNVEGPQYPQLCNVPNKSEQRKRRLGEKSLTEEEASLACSRVSDKEREMCIFDVLALNDMDIAGAY